MTAATTMHVIEDESERIVMSAVEEARRSTALHHLARMSDDELIGLGWLFSEVLAAALRGDEMPAAEFYSIGQRCYRKGIPLRELTQFLRLLQENALLQPLRARAKACSGSQAGVNPDLQESLNSVFRQATGLMVRGYEDALR